MILYKTTSTFIPLLVCIRAFLFVDVCIEKLVQKDNDPLILDENIEMDVNWQSRSSGAGYGIDICDGSIGLQIGSRAAVTVLIVAPMTALQGSVGGWLPKVS